MGRPQFEARPKFWTRLNLRPKARPGQANEARPGLRVCRGKQVHVHISLVKD